MQPQQGRRYERWQQRVRRCEGFNALRGVRYYFSERIALFSEGKYYYALFDASTSGPSGGQASKAIIRPICVGEFRFTSASRSRGATDDPRMPSWKAVAAIPYRFRSTAHDSPVTR
jgi:hypothetical protein